MKRATFYIDGFNLYYGLVTARYNDCKWLDIVQLANKIKNSNHQITSTKYFTSRVTNNPAKQKRQSTYLDALNSTAIELIYGQFLAEQVVCKFCKTLSWEIKEKMTDVNIATTLIKDAFTNRFDVAYLISADSDLLPVLKLIREFFPNKQLFVVFPPKRKSLELKFAAHSSFTLSHRKLRESQLPNKVLTRSGVIIMKPKEWP